MTIYTGIGSVIAPAGSIAAIIEAWGDGGGGRAAVFQAAGAGGGGAYAANLLFPVVGGSTSLFYNAGAGGHTGGIGAASPGAGTWISTTGAMPLDTSQGVFAPGGGNSSGTGFGGLVSSAIGFVKFAGGDGDQILLFGGGGAGSSGSGQNGSSGGIGGPPDGGNGDFGAGASAPGGGGSIGGGGIPNPGAPGRVRITFIFSQPLFAKVKFSAYGRSPLRVAAPNTYTQYTYTQNIPVVSAQISFASQLNAALASVQVALATVPALRDATLVQLEPISLAVSNALSTFTGIASVLDTQISTTNVAGIFTGIPAPQIVETFLGQVSAVEQLSVLLNAVAVLGRIQTNLLQATG